MKRLALLPLVLVYGFGFSLDAQNLLPNPGFETGTDTPEGWKFSGGGKGERFSPGRSGGRCLSVTGSGTGSSHWHTENLRLAPGKLYQLSFWGRKAPETSGGCVVTGPSRINRDFRFTETWTRYSFKFAVPETGADDFMRLGQWEQKGAIYFDDVELIPVDAISSTLNNGLVLGDGETIESGVYHCRLNYGGAAINYHRPLHANRCGFNSDRWTFSTDSEVVYRHTLAGAGFKSARLRVNVNYYVGGQLEIAASRDGQSWQTVTNLQGQRASGDVELPGALFPAAGLFVRLKGVGQSCNQQVNSYQLEARLDKNLADARGGTSYLAWRRNSGQVSAVLENLQWSAAAGGFVFSLMVQNTSKEALDLKAALKTGTQPPVVGRLPSLPPNGSMAANLLARVAEAGTHEVQIELADAKGEILLAGETTVQLGFLQDPRPGYWLAKAEGTDVWWCESGWKIGRDRRPPFPPAGKPAPIKLSAARGEYEAVQVALSPSRDTRLVSAALKPLIHPDGKSSLADVVLNEVAYVNVTVPTDKIGERGWHPDPLPPLQAPLALKAGLNQPIWITVHVPDNAPPGRYSGNLALKTTEASFDLPVEIEIYDFTLPKESHLRSGLGLSSHAINRYHHLNDPAQRLEVYEKYLRNFAEHRISPYSFFDYAPIDVRFEGDQSSKQARLDFAKFDQAAARWIDEYKFNSFRLPLRGMGGGTFHSRHLGSLEGFQEGTPEFARLFRDYVGQIEKHLGQKGWLDEAYVYWFDEPDPKDYEFVADGMKRIKAAAPGLRRMLTEQPEPGLTGNVEIWCALTPEWTREKVQARRAAGEEVWWYICCGPHAPYITEFIDHPGTELRLWPWQSWQYGVQGILIWATTYWTSPLVYPEPNVQDPWEDPMSYVSGYGRPVGHVGYWGNGDGRFIYPPRGALAAKAPVLDGPVNSTRWENLRDGMEDYEYFWLLQQAIEKAEGSKAKPELLQQARELLPVPDAISMDLTHFTTDPRLILEHRDKIARMIGKLKGARP